MWQEGPALFSSFQGQGFHNRPIIRAVEHLGQLLQRQQHHCLRLPSHIGGVPSYALGQVVACVAGAALDIDQVPDQTHLQSGFLMGFHQCRGLGGQPLVHLAFGKGGLVASKGIAGRHHPDTTVRLADHYPGGFFYTRLEL